MAMLVCGRDARCASHSSPAPTGRYRSLLLTTNVDVIVVVNAALDAVAMPELDVF